MNVKKNLFMIVWGTIVVLLLGGCGYLLYRQRAAFVGSKEMLAGAEQSLQGLNRRNPFPSTANVSVTETNLAVLEAHFAEFMDSLSADQIREEEMEGARFLTVLEQTRDALNTQAMDFDVVVPPQFAYGFDPYVAGAIPATEDVPRLTVQLRMAEALSQLMFSNRVAGITSVTRTPFEQPGEGAAGGIPAMGPDLFGAFGGGYPGAAEAATVEADLAVDESDLYSVEHFNVTFAAKGPSVMDVIRALAYSGLFAVVTDVAVTAGGDTPGAIGGEFRGYTPGRPGMGEFMPPAYGGPEALMMRETMGGPPRMRPGGRTPQGAGRSNLLRDDRQVAGEEVLQVTMGVDVYRFKPQEEEENLADAEGELFPGMEPGSEVVDPAPAETEL